MLGRPNFTANYREDNLKKLFKYLKGYVKESVLGPLFKLAEATLELIVPLIIAAIVDVGIKNSDTGYITGMCLLLVGMGAHGYIPQIRVLLIANDYITKLCICGYSTCQI